jgi:hypothetical protein
MMFDGVKARVTESAAEDQEHSRSLNSGLGHGHEAGQLCSWSRQLEDCEVGTCRSPVQAVPVCCETITDVCTTARSDYISARKHRWLLRNAGLSFLRQTCSSLTSCVLQEPTLGPLAWCDRSSCLCYHHAHLVQRVQLLHQKIQAARQGRSCSAQSQSASLALARASCL